MTFNALHGQRGCPRAIKTGSGNCRFHMAKGNDGNYLQHSIEVEIAAHLAQAGGEGRLHIALTHGMEPFEPFEQPLDEPIPGLARRRLRCALAAPESDESPVVAAYRETGACEKHYPNSAELLRAVVGTDKLAGGITEVDCAKHERLADAWSGSCVAPVCSSWRHQVEPGGILTACDDLRTPWLFSMDPMTYIENGVEDDCRLHGADIGRLSSALSSFVKSGMPGIATVFVYAVRPEIRRMFWGFMDELETIGMSTCSYWLTHRGGNRNLAGLLHTKNIQLPPDFPPRGIAVGRT